jgi:hypothetical protein
MITGITWTYNALLFHNCTCAFSFWGLEHQRAHGLRRQPPGDVHP